MYLLERSKKYAVINVKDIERPVHLIPKFGLEVGKSVKVKQELDDALTCMRLDRVVNRNEDGDSDGDSDGEDDSAANFNLPVLDFIIIFDSIPG